MDKIILNTLLITVALAMPAWMAWRKANKRSWLGGWLLAVVLLAIPFGLTLWLHPEWLNHPVSDLVKHLLILPALLSLCALGGGLVFLVAPLALALFLGGGKALGTAFKGVKWRQEYSKSHQSSDDFYEVDWYEEENHDLKGNYKY